MVPLHLAPQPAVALQFRFRSVLSAGTGRGARLIHSLINRIKRHGYAALQTVAHWKLLVLRNRLHRARLRMDIPYGVVCTDRRARSMILELDGGNLYESYHFISRCGLVLGRIVLRANLT